MKFPLNNDDFVLNPVHGLICLQRTRIFKGRKDTVFVICNPSTGQSLALPRVKTESVVVMGIFGYDPIDKHFKLLSIPLFQSGRNTFSQEYQILTLGNGKLSWRMIECSVPHYPLRDGICVNGVLYYPAKVRGFEGKFGIACLDIRSKKFKFIEKEDRFERAKLVNYKGKLATCRSDRFFGSICEIRSSIELCVLEDAEKNEWSAHTYVLPHLSPDIVSPEGMDVKGVTRTGEIVLAPSCPSDPFYLVYYNLERNTVIKVEIQGIDVSEDHVIHTSLDHVQDVKLGGVFKTS